MVRWQLPHDVGFLFIYIGADANYRLAGTICLPENKKHKALLRLSVCPAVCLSYCRFYATLHFHDQAADLDWIWQGDSWGPRIKIGYLFFKKVIAKGLK